MMNEATDLMHENRIWFLTGAKFSLNGMKTKLEGLR